MLRRRLSNHIRFVTRDDELLCQEKDLHDLLAHGIAFEEEIIDRGLWVNGATSLDKWLLEYSDKEKLAHFASLARKEG